MWKNGQCVTIKGKRYRVKSRQLPYLPCPACAMVLERPEFSAFVNTLAGNEICDKLCFSVLPKLGDNQYLEEICGNQGS